MRGTLKKNKHISNNHPYRPDHKILRAPALRALVVFVCVFTLCLIPCTSLAADAPATDVSADAPSASSSTTDASASDSSADAQLIEAQSLDEYISLTEPDLKDAVFDVSKSTGQITGTSEKKTFKKTFGKPFREVKGDAQEMAETIDSTDGYQISGENKKTIHVASSYGLKRILVTGIPEDTFGAQSAVTYNGETILTYDSEESTKAAYAVLVQTLGQDQVFLDVPMTATETEEEATAQDDVQPTTDGSAAIDESIPQDDLTAQDDVQTTTDESDAEYKEVSPFHGWGTEWMHLDDAMDKFANSNEQITIAVLDSGINPKHEIYENTKISPDSRSFLNDSDSIEDDYVRRSASGEVISHSHGNKICGIIAESTTPNVSLLVLKIMNSEGAASAISFYQAMDYAAEHDADIINVSMGLFYEAETRATMDEHLKDVASKDVLICASTGNNAKNMDGSKNVTVDDYGKLFYPAASPYTVSVGALGVENDVPYYASNSNYGDALDFMAPGVNLSMAVYDSELDEYTYESRNGTSFACPYVCACAAFVKMNDPSNTADTIREQLIQISDDLGDAGWDGSYGFGMPDFSNQDNLKPVTFDDTSIISMEAKRLAFDGTNRHPAFSVNHNRWELTCYDLEFSNDTPDIGTHNMIITLNGSYADSYVFKNTYKIIPQSVTVNDYATIKSGGSKVKFSWSKSQGSYQLMVSRNRKFTSPNKYLTSKPYKIVSGLKRGKHYYVKVRAVKKVDGKNYYSEWSEIRGPYKW